MDLSKEYILMCEKAEEIQGGKYRTSLDNVLFCSEHRAQIYHEDGLGDTCIKIEFNEDDKEDCSCCLDNLIWLPRQDQLQEMLAMYPDVASIIHEIVRFIRINDQSLVTMEQHLIKMVMFYEYKKTWNGKEWVKA